MSLRIIGRDIPNPAPLAGTVPHIYDQLADALQRVSQNIFFRSLEESHCTDLSAINAILMQNAKTAQKNVGRLIGIQKWMDSLIKNLEKIRTNCENSSGFSFEKQTGLLAELQAILSDDPKIVRLYNISDYQSESVQIVCPVKDALASGGKTPAIYRRLVNHALYEVKQIHNSIIYQISDNKKHITNQIIMRENSSAQESRWSKKDLAPLVKKLNR